MKLSDFNQKWHGIPIWVWCLIVGIGLYFFTQMGGNSAGGPTAQNTAGTEPITPVSSTIGAIGSSAYATLAAYPGTVVSQSGTVLTSPKVGVSGYIHPAAIGTTTSGGAA